ncbi:MAG: ATP-binding protein [Cyclobacteriaceae bacterium]
MTKSAKDTFEIARLQSLLDYQIIDTPAEADFDDITKIASEICKVPIALITLLDQDRQWFKSHHGIQDTETPRKHAFCNHAIKNPSEIMIVNDSTKDERFKSNPLVTGKPHVHFYAGMPLVNSDGYPMGTLCVIDNKPNTLTDSQIDSIKALANQVVAQFELRKKIRQLEDFQKKLEATNQELDRFAQVVSHDIKGPLSNIQLMTELLAQQHKDILPEKSLELSSLIVVAAKNLVKMVSAILEHTRALNFNAEEFNTFIVMDLIKEVLSLIPVNYDAEFDCSNNLSEIHTSEIALKQILLNLITNAIKYNDKEKAVISISSIENHTHYIFTVSDNGPGIPEKSKKEVFGLLKTLGIKDRFKEKGTGIGLSTVKKLVEKLDGTIELHSEMGKGCSFVFSLTKK